MISRKRHWIAALPCLLLAGFIWIGAGGEKPVDKGEAGAGLKQKQSDEDWLRTWRVAPAQADWGEGIRWAGKRAAQMAEWMEHDPDKALQNRLSFTEYTRLPAEVAMRIERPFAGLATVSAIPYCGPEESSQSEEGTHPAITYWMTRGDKRQRLFLPSAREGLLSKRNLPVTGLELGDRAVLFEEPILAIPDHEVTSAKKLLEIVGTGGRGGGAFLFGDRYRAGLEDLAVEPYNALLRRAERLPFPVFTLPEGGTHPMEFSLAALEQAIQMAAFTWTESPKSVLYVRLEFPSGANSAPAQDELEQILNSVSARIGEISYGKTVLDPIEVTAEVFILPHSATDYLAKGYYGLYLDAVELVKSAGYEVTDYDIVGVWFPTVSGFPWAGRAIYGAGEQWINGNLAARVFLHEFGHNYGLGHASSWSANDGSVLPFTGTEWSSSSDEHDEYGDIFDRMGSGNFGDDFNPHGKFLLNWLAESDVVRLEDAGRHTLRLYRFDAPQATDQGPLAVRVQHAGSEPLWIGYRQSTTNQHLKSGASVLWEYLDSRSRLLDMTPDSQSSDYTDKQDAALSIGRTFMDPAGQVQITPLARGGAPQAEWLDIEFQLGMERASLDQRHLLVPASGQSYTVNLTTENFWRVANVYDWIEVSPASGTGSAVVTVDIAEHSGLSQREAHLFIGGQNLSIVQAGSRDVPVLDAVEAIQLAGTQAVRVVYGLDHPSNRSVAVHLEGKAAGEPEFQELTVVEGEIGDVVEPGSNKVIIWRAGEEWPEFEEGLVQLRIRVVDTSSAVLTDEMPPFLLDMHYLDVDPPAYPVGPEGGSYMVFIQSNTNWSVSESLDWLSVDPLTGSGNATLSVTVGTHFGRIPRTGTISIELEETGVAESALHQVNQSVAQLTLWGNDVGEDGWYLSSWYAPLIVPKEASPWLFHPWHGWQYWVGISPESVYLFDRSIGSWIWTSSNAYPFLYKFGIHEGWYLYLEGSIPGGRWFHDLKADEPINESQLTQINSGTGSIPARAF